MENKQWIHLIGICGVTMAPLANMLKKMGWFVSGSDKGIFPPMSDYLKDKKILIELGFKREHLNSEYYLKRKQAGISKHPDLVVVGNYVGLNDPEYKYAKSLNLAISSYPEVLAEYLVKENSIVVAGTYGKTTSSALLALIWREARKDPAFMIGGIANNFSDGIENSQGKWSIIEGDEYTSSRFDMQSKFFHYKPEFLLLTAASWEHTDVFKTEQGYIDNFKKLVKTVSPNGIIVACRDGANIMEVVKEARCKVVTYELNKVDDNLAKSDWFNLSHKENSLAGEIVISNRHSVEEFSVKTTLIGDHNKENIIGCCALARELSIDVNAIRKAVAGFSGIKRRLEVRYSEENLKVIDDHACSPPKIRGSLKALRDNFEDWFITIIFEPNVGNRTKDSFALFKGVFKEADEVVIPALKFVKTAKGERRTSGEELAEYLKVNGSNTMYIGEDDKLVDYVTKGNRGKHIICFMGAYSFRGMIEQVVKKVGY